MWVNITALWKLVKCQLTPNTKIVKKNELEERLKNLQIYDNELFSSFVNRFATLMDEMKGVGMTNDEDMIKEQIKTLLTDAKDEIKSVYDVVDCQPDISTKSALELLRLMEGPVGNKEMTKQRMEKEKEGRGEDKQKRKREKGSQDVARSSNNTPDEGRTNSINTS